MISFELCEISLIFREIKTTTAKQFLPTCSKSQKNIDLYDWNYAARPERAEALSPGQRPGYKGSQQGAL